MLINDTELEFLDHSNRIESQYSDRALEDAVQAWGYMRESIITLDSILKTHKLLMRRLRPDIAGKLRNCGVTIGDSKKIFISESLLKEELEFVCDRIQCSDEIKCITDEVEHESVTKRHHIAFEHVHPFEDGNGRVGRIIYNAHRLLLDLPIHVIHEGEEQMEYYKWFK